MKQNSKTPRFEIDHKTRQAQSREAKKLAAFRATGKKKYFVRKLRSKEELNQLYGNGPVKVAYGGIAKYILDDVALNYYLDFVFGKNTEVKWLKPKEATLLRLQGYAVEESE
jgi:hypothetical protein